MNEQVNESIFQFDLRLDRTPLEMTARLTSHHSRIAVIGPSGSGKTTLLRMIAGLERHATGRLVFSQKTWLDTSENIFIPPWQRSIGYVPQESLLFPHLSVFDNLAFSAAAASEKIKTVAKPLRLIPLLDRRARTLSGGERQRVALARAVLSHPQLLLLDEPFSALDRPMRQIVSAWLARTCDELNLPLMIVSHDHRDLEPFQPEIYSMDEGVLTRTVMPTKAEV